MSADHTSPRPVESEPHQSAGRRVRHAGPGQPQRLPPRPRVSELEVLKEIRDARVLPAGSTWLRRESGPGPRHIGAGGSGPAGSRRPVRLCPRGALRRGEAASRRGSAAGPRLRCRQPEAAHPTPGPYRPPTSGTADRRRSEPIWASASAASPAAMASNLAVQGRGRCSYAQDTAAPGEASGRADTVRERRRHDTFSGKTATNGRPRNDR